MHGPSCLADSSADWTLAAVVAQESAGVDLPVLALGQADWPHYLAAPNKAGRALQTARAELTARHPSGWRVARFVRAQAWLDANADAITLAATEADPTRQAAQRAYSLSASSTSWAGNGITLGTPWWPLCTLCTSGHWQWQADVSLLHLQKLRRADLGGTLNNNEAGTYDFDLWSQRSNTDITGRFLPASGDAGSGRSWSLAVQGQPVPGWQLAVRADDIASRLQWDDLATDANTLKSAVATLRPDGYLDYAPYLRGKKSLWPITSPMAPRWQLTVQRALSTDDPSGAALTWQMSRQASIDQIWIGWRNGSATTALPHFSLAFEPHWPALQFEATWRDWRLLIATDGKGLNTQYRRLELAWQTAL